MDLTLITGIATLISTSSTLITILFFYWQLRESERANLGEFILRLHDSFFLDKTNSRIISVIEADKKILKENGGQHTEEELDNFLGAIELLSVYAENKILKKKLLRRIFGHYIEKTNLNKEIQNYIEKINIKENDQFYKGLSYLNNKLQFQPRILYPSIMLI